MVSMAFGLGPPDREPVTHSFVVRIWLEDIAADRGHVAWRGHVTHVPDNARRYFEDLAALPAFIVPYLHDSGVRFTWYRRFWLWIGNKKWQPKGWSIREWRW